MKNIRNKIPAPKITLDRIGQIIFTFKEIVGLALKTNSKLLYLIFVVNIIWGFSAIPGFYLDKLILDNLVAGIGSTDLIGVLKIIGFFIFLRFLLEFIRSLLSRISRFSGNVLSRSFSAEIDVLMGSKLSQLDMGTIEDPEFKDRFNKIERESGRRAWGVMMPLSDIPNYLVGFISSLGLLLFLSPLVIIGIVIVSIPQFFIDSKFIKKEYALNTELSPLYRMWGWLGYYLVRNRNYMELKILNLLDYLTNKLRIIQKETIEKHVNLSRQREISRIGTFTLVSIFDLAVAIWIAFLVLVGRLTLGSFQMYLSALRNAQSNLVSLVSTLLEIYENYIYVNDLVWFLNLTPKISQNEKGIKIKKDDSVNIEFEKVWFRYKKDQPWIIKNVSFKIDAGEIIAIVGENGAGKSTLIKLIARFYDPQKGKILVNGIELSEYNVVSWQEKMAILFQEFETYPFSVKETIGYGDVDRINKSEEIKEVARKTGVDKFIEDLPLKYENPLAPEFDKGIQPSIGQWQRLGISRMLFRKKAGILILDEPTSNVDPVAEENIFNQLSGLAKNKILIFVTQRFSTVRIADRIMVVERGGVVEMGTHKELMDKDGRYKRLFNLQAHAYLT